MMEKKFGLILKKFNKMKKAEEYIENFWGAINDGIDSSDRYISGYDVALVIKQAQIEAIEETCRVCVEDVELKEFDKIPQDRDSICNDMGDVYAVDLEKILSVADKLKKELE